MQKEAMFHGCGTGLKIIVFTPGLLRSVGNSMLYQIFPKFVKGAFEKTTTFPAAALANACEAAPQVMVPF
jgi:hypothetical protein